MSGPAEPDHPICPLVASSAMILLAGAAYAGLGPAGVLVVYNADVPDAVDVAHAYEAARALPPGRLCGLSGLDPLMTEIPWEQFADDVLDPLDACLGALPDPDEIDALVTVRGLPYAVTLDGYVVGLEALLQVGHGIGLTGDELAGAAQKYDPGGFYVASVRNPEFVGIAQACAAADLTVSNPSGGWYVGTCALQDEHKLPGSFRRDGKHEYA